MGAETPDAGTDYLLAELEHRITTLTLNRTESRNALTGEISEGSGDATTICDASENP